MQHLKKKQLTLKKSINDPKTTRPGCFAYKSGDIGLGERMPYRGRLHRLRVYDKRCRNTSYKVTAAATDTFKLSTVPTIGIAAK